jgi:MFS family permease
VVAFAEGFRAPSARYWLSAFLSDFGDGLRLAAFPLLAAHFTRSPTAVAAVTALQGLPWLVLGAGAGVIVDRTDWRRVMVTMSTAQAVILAALAVAILAHSAGLLLIYVTAIVTGIAAGLRGTAASASVPRLVHAADLDQANGRIIAGRVVGNELAGPAAGGGCSAWPPSCRSRSTPGHWASRCCFCRLSPECSSPCPDMPPARFPLPGQPPCAGISPWVSDGSGSIVTSAISRSPWG